MDIYTRAPAPHDCEPSYEDSAWMHEEIAYYTMNIQRVVYLHEFSDDNAWYSGAPLLHYSEGRHRDHRYSSYRYTACG